MSKLRDALKTVHRTRDLTLADKIYNHCRNGGMNHQDMVDLYADANRLDERDAFSAWDELMMDLDEQGAY